MATGQKWFKQVGDTFRDVAEAATNCIIKVTATFHEKPVGAVATLLMFAIFAFVAITWIRVRQ